MGQEREDSFRPALAATGLGVWDWNILDGISDWCANTRRLIRATNEPASFDAFLSKIDREDVEKVERAFAEARDPRGSGILDTDFRVAHAKGPVRWIHIRGSAFFHGDGEARRAHRLLLTLLDVTDHRQAEESQRFLSEATSVLSSSSIDYRATLESVARLVVPRLADWCVVDLIHWDKTVERVSIAHVDPRKTALIREITRRFPPTVDHPFCMGRVISTGKPIVGAQISEAQLFEFAPDPAELTALRNLGLRSYMVVPLTARARTLGTLILVSAESGRTYSEADLPLVIELARRAAIAVDNARLYDESQRASRMREEMLAIVSHDLRSPLGVISMGLNLLEKDLRAGAPSRRFIETTQRSIKRMDRLIGALLDVANVQAGRLAVDKSSVDLAPIVQEAVESQRGVAAEKGVELTSVFDAPIGAQMMADRDRLLQVLGNLIGNAIKYSDSGASVVVETHIEKDSANIAVSDTGNGIAYADLPHVFEPFWSGQKSSGGSGLGLYIAKGVVEAHGGHIEAKSEVGRGSTFAFTLPRA